MPTAAVSPKVCEASPAVAHPSPTARRLLQAGALALAIGLTACGEDSSDQGARTQTGTSAVTVTAGACKPGAVPTPANTEGPYFKPGSPERASLLDPGLDGTRLLLSGRVLTTDCRAVPDAKLDFWQADDAGRYDNQGFRLRGHQVTDSRGRYRLRTIVPAQYESRPPHIHVKVKPRGGAVFTTQLYFPGAERNQGDSFFDKRLLIDVRNGPGGERGSFDFVVDGG